jgi:hypothetical protein
VTAEKKTSQDDGIKFRAQGALSCRSPCEQIVTTINIALRRRSQQLLHYTEGNVPPGLLSAPEGWSTQQIAETAGPRSATISQLAAFWSQSRAQLVMLQQRQWLARRLRSGLAEDRLQHLHAWRERVAIGVYCIAQRSRQRGDLFVGPRCA